MREYTSERIISGELELNNCGVQSLCDRDYNITRSRIDYTLMFVSKGRADVLVDGRYVPVMSGEAMFFPPDAVQSYIFLAENKSVNKWVHFGGSLCIPLASKGVSVIKIAHLNEFESALDRLINAYYGSGAMRKVLCDGYMRVIFALLSASIGKADKLSNGIEERIKPVCDYIHTHLNEETDLDRLAAEMFVSRSRFNHIFKQYTGLSPVAYIKTMRIERAKQYLCDSGLKVSECAEALGFGDVNYFCRCFREVTGMSPLEFRNN